MLPCVLVLSTLMGATVWAPTEEAVIQRADEVVLITVRAVDTRVHRGTLLVQDVQGEVSWRPGSSALKPKQLITIEVLGGELQGRVSLVAGSFRPQVGDQALVYLSKHGLAYRPWGLSYGWLPLTEGADGRLWLRRSLSGLDIVGEGQPVEQPWQKRSLKAQLNVIAKLREGRPK